MQQAWVWLMRHIQNPTPRSESEIPTCKNRIYHIIHMHSNSSTSHCALQIQVSTQWPRPKVDIIPTMTQWPRPVVVAHIGAQLVEANLEKMNQ